MRKTWRDLEKDHDAHVAESERNSSDLRKEMISFHSELTEEIRGLRDDIKPMLEVFSSTRFTGRFAAKALAVLAIIVGMAVGIKSAFFH